MHAVDWLPTLWEAVGGDPAELANEGLDGLSHWKSLQGLSESNDAMSYGDSTQHGFSSY